MSGSPKDSNPACPRCAARTRRYIYGLAMIDPAYEDDVVIAGCEIHDGMPQYECSACGHEF